MSAPKGKSGSKSSCRSCGKPVGLIRRLKGASFCSAACEHTDDFAPASMVLQTLLRDIPSTPEPVIEHTPESALADYDEVLSSLLDFGSAQTTTPPTEPVPPPLCGPEMELPVERPFGDGQSIAPRHVSLEWVDGFYGVELGEHATPFAPDALFRGDASAKVSARPVDNHSAGDPPFAAFIVTLVPAVGSYRAAERIEPVALRRGVRPSFLHLTGPNATRIRWDAPKKVLPPREAIALPASRVAHPPSTSDLQDSLVDMLVNMVDA